MQSIYKSQGVVQVNIPAESGEMGVLANHVPSIEQLKPGLVEVVEEGGSTKQFFRTSLPVVVQLHRTTTWTEGLRSTEQNRSADGDERIAG